MTYHLVFDKFPSPEGSRFIELEDSTGHSISAGEWRERKDGYVELVLPAPLSKDCTQTSVELLQRFADQYRSGAAGAEMDCDAAQALAEAIDSSIRASETVWKDIATAPRDVGATIVGWCVYPAGAEPRICRFERSYFPKTPNEGSWWAYGISQTVTHWMPLPSPPKPLSYEGE